MPTIRAHQAISEKRTGKTYEKLHRWMDNDKNTRGTDHQNEKHIYTDALKKEVYDKFGEEEAVSEWLFHIALDALDSSVIHDQETKKLSINFQKFGFTRDGFVHYYEEDLSDESFKDEFEDDFD